MKVRTFIAATLLGLLSLGHASAKNLSINDLPSEEVRTLTQQAYIFSYPLIMNYATMYKQAINQHAPEYVGGFGHFRHYGFATSENKDIVSPNNDTPYSWAWVDLRAEPWILVMPPVDSERYYASQWDDMWGFVLDSPGSVMDGDKGGIYLIAPANWLGTVPAGVKRVIRSESLFAGTLTRTGANGLDDLTQVKAIQAGYQLMPLHRYLQQPAPAFAPPVKWLPFVQGDEKPPEAFKYVNLMLAYTLPDARDKTVLAAMAKLGIAAGKPWDTATLSAATRSAMQEGIHDALETMTAKMKNVRSSALFNTRENLQTDYIDRMIGVYVGIFGNYASQATYFTWHKDTDGHQINTANGNYKLTFKRGETPPADYFWSITIYTMPERFLVPNVLHRYSIGSRSPQLKTNMDGSIDIYISQQAPVKELESNWLPAPDGEPYIIMRVYGPGESVMNGGYEPPPIVRLK